MRMAKHLHKDRRTVATIIIVALLLALPTVFQFRTVAAQPATEMLVQPLPGADCLPTVTVTNAADSGAGSLRQALVDICDEGEVTPP